MAEKVSLKVMRCPTCGAQLKAKNNTESITCVYCGNLVVPVAEATAAPALEKSGQVGGVIRVEGMRTPASALAYIEQYFEDCDWEAFVYAQTLSVVEIDKLTDSMKVSSADDPNTWFAAFRAVATPFAHKIAGCGKILASVIEDYKKDNLDAYSKFDAYKRIAGMILTHKDEIVAKLVKITAKAEKYGASSAEISGLNADIEKIKNHANLLVYSDIESIPEISAFINERNAQVVADLAAKGIHAQSEYERAKTLIEEGNYADALNVLRSLQGYADTKSLITKLDQYFLMSNVLEICGKLYYFKQVLDASGRKLLNLHPFENGMIAGKPVVKNIYQMITNHADVLYYLDGDKYLKLYNPSTNKEYKIYDKAIDKESIHVYGRKVYMLADRSDSVKRDVVVLDTTDGSVQVFLEKVKGILALTGNKMTYTLTHKSNQDGYSVYQTETNIINVDTLEMVELGARKVSIEGFVGDYVVYTQAAPNKFNKNLYIKSFDVNEPEKLVEQNIYKFCNIISGKLFYYIGNSRNNTLININCDGTDRREWPLFIHSVLFEQGGWLYFIRKAGYTSVLCKSHMDGSEYAVIAADIEKFISIKNGYLYYINDEDTLVRVRMDGTNLQELCEDVESVLSVCEDKIVFVSVDDRITIGEMEQASTRTVKSVYAVDFTGSGKIKLAYNVSDARKYDENTVYYIAAEEIKSSYDRLEKRMNMLYRLDVETNNTEKLMELTVVETQTDKLSGFAIAMIVMAIAFFFTFVGIVAEAIAMVFLSAIVGIFSLVVGISIKNKDK